MKRVLDLPHRAYDFNCMISGLGGIPAVLGRIAWIEEEAFGRLAALGAGKEGGGR